MEVTCIVGFVLLAIVAIVFNVVVYRLNQKVVKLQAAVNRMLTTIVESCNALSQYVDSSIEKNSLQD